MESLKSKGVLRGMSFSLHNTHALVVASSIWLSGPHLRRYCFKRRVEESQDTRNVTVSRRTYNQAHFGVINITFTADCESFRATSLARNVAWIPLFPSSSFDVHTDCRNTTHTAIPLEFERDIKEVHSFHHQLFYGTKIFTSLRCCESID